MNVIRSRRARLLSKVRGHCASKMLKIKISNFLLNFSSCLFQVQYLQESTYMMNQKLHRSAVIEITHRNTSTYHFFLLRYLSFDGQHVSSVWKNWNHWFLDCMFHIENWLFSSLNITLKYKLLQRMVFLTNVSYVILLQAIFIFSSFEAQ